MAAIHFVERLENVHRIPGQANRWESGYWVVSHETAAKLVGGDLYLHRRQGDPSHFGGRIVGWRVHSDPADPEIDSRIVFAIEPSLAHKGVRAENAGWGNEKKIVW